MGINHLYIILKIFIKLPWLSLEFSTNKSSRNWFDIFLENKKNCCKFNTSVLFNYKNT